MATVQSAHNAIVDGMVRGARQGGMSVDQMRQAGRTMVATLREAQAANPLLAEYFPGLGQWSAALTGAIELALTDLTREVAPAVSNRISSAYAGVTGTDRHGRPVEIGPLLRGELIQRIADGASNAELRTHILASQEIGDTRRAIVEDAYQTHLGRGSSLAERAELSTFIDRRLAEGGTLQGLDQEIQSRVLRSPEKALLERVGVVFHSRFPEHDAPNLSTKRSWTDWVQSAMARGLPEELALMALAQHLREGA